MNKLLTWEELDNCNSADEIASLLRANNIKGMLNSSKHCPLAIATGWRVYNVLAFKGIVKFDEKTDCHVLTQAETDFIRHFDTGIIYSDLILKY